MTITDTQILSYYYKRTLSIPRDPLTISSITAAEFLLIQSETPNKANYYPILPSRLHYGPGPISGQLPALRILAGSRKRLAAGKHRTDQLLLDFGGRFPTFIEFGSVAISQIINGGVTTLFATSISHLDKDLQKELRAKLDFLVGAEVQCVPVTREIATVGMNLLAAFLDKYEAKRNPRNTVNDILILSTAINRSSPLLTEDSLLKRFAADFLQAKYEEKTPVGLLIDFSSSEVSNRRKPLESRSYTNRGWQIVERRRR